MRYVLYNFILFCLLNEQISFAHIAHVPHCVSLHLVLYFALIFITRHFTFFLYTLVFFKCSDYFLWINKISVRFIKWTKIHIKYWIKKNYIYNRNYNTRGALLNKIQIGCVHLIGELRCGYNDVVRTFGISMCAVRNCGILTHIIKTKF